MRGRIAFIQKEALMSASLTTISSRARPSLSPASRVSALTAFALMTLFSAGLWYGIAHALMWLAVKL